MREGRPIRVGLAVLLDSLPRAAEFQKVVLGEDEDDWDATEVS